MTRAEEHELLGLAAKAAGVDYCNGVDLDTGSPWNPIDDDGDEARLEAALGLNVQWREHYVIVEKGSSSRFFSTARYADHGGDKQAARRLAGVRAAAEIGKAMQ